jgi:methionyl aminopeptidase
MQGLKKMRAACKLAAEVLEYAGTLVQPGVTTDAIDQAVHDMCVSRGAYPSPLNYGKFPKSVCTSVNECVCHGIPDDRPLQKGDIINIDVTVYLDGHHGDTSRMFFVGEVSPKARALCDATKEALDAAIKVWATGRQGL